jgi:hypothetical protein
VTVRGRRPAPASAERLYVRVVLPRWLFDCSEAAKHRWRTRAFLFVSFAALVLARFGALIRWGDFERSPRVASLAAACVFGLVGVVGGELGMRGWFERRRP